MGRLIVRFQEEPLERAPLFLGDKSHPDLGKYSREEGSGYTKDYDAGIGIRYSF